MNWSGAQKLSKQTITTKKKTKGLELNTKTERINVNNNSEINYEVVSNFIERYKKHFLKNGK